MPRGFRFEPTTVPTERIIDRSRLVGLLNGRFEHRVTSVVGAAGFGKSTALATSVANNHLDPAGRDLWITVATAGVTGSQLLDAVATACGVDSGGDDDQTIERITDALWSGAPDEIAIIIDDAHLADGDGAIDALRQLLAELPANGHLVLGSRTRLDLPVARLRAMRQLLEIGERELELDDAELAALEARDTNHDIGELRLPRHIATADLQLAAGVDASADFLWEEVLVRLDDDRLAHLRRCAVLDQLDDDLVRAVTDGDHDVETLLTGLPLVEEVSGGRRMHAILRDALVKRLQPGERRKALSIAAIAEQERGRLAIAATLHDLADDPISALDAARQFAMAQTLIQTMDDVITVRRIAHRIRPDSPVARFLDALTHFAGLEDHIADRFIDAADAARSVGDRLLEAVALYRAGQSQLLHHSTAFRQTRDRLSVLAEDDEFAGAVMAYFRSIEEQLKGNPEASVEALDDIGPLGRATVLNIRAERLYDLGRPEQVAVGWGPDDFANLPPGAAAFIGISMWSRGDSSPEEALTSVEISIARALRARYTHTAVSYLGSGVQIALAAGAGDTARRWAALARDEVSGGGVGAAIAELELISRASVASTFDSDDTAIEMLRNEQPDHEFSHGDTHRWPSRAKLGALPLVYLARRDLREMLDNCGLGSTLGVVLQAARSLVAIREHGDVTGSGELAWGRISLFRAHVLPHHLVELVCAAIADGNDDARLLLDVLPHTERSLRRVAESDVAVVANVATELLGATPRSEPFTLHALLLGEVVLQRDGIDVDSPDFAARHKVRELFALLHERGRLQRHEICAALWPEHDDEDRALASLRTTLSTLNGVLEPDRERGHSAFHLKVSGDIVQLDDRVTTDVAVFERIIDDAQAQDSAGIPARALNDYRRAAELYRGDYLHGIDAPWLVLTRLRLRTLAVSAVCRVAELTAARGEPEEAARWAARGRSIDPLSERSGRLFVSCLDAIGDRSAAREAAAELDQMLRDAGLPREAATERLLNRFG